MSNESIKDLSSNHHFRTEIPNILFSLGLKPTEIAVYLILKKTAGDNGYCIKSSQRISDEANVNIKTYYEVKKTLSTKIFPIIQKPLISVTERKKKTGDADTSLIEIIDIWPENYVYFQKDVITEILNKSTTKNGGTTKIEHEIGTSKMSEGVPPKTEDKEEPLQEEPIIYSSSSSKRNLSARDHTPQKIEVEIYEPLEKVNAAAAFKGEVFQYVGSGGIAKTMVRSDVYRYFIKDGYSPDLCDQAIEKLVKRKHPITNVFTMLQFIINDLIISNNKEIKKEKPNENINKYAPQKHTGKGVTIADLINSKK